MMTNCLGLEELSPKYFPRLLGGRRPEDYAVVVQGTDRPVFSISAVATMLGVRAATLRTWEDRYALVIPDRNEGGHRLYRRDQVEQLRFVRARMAEGLSAADAHRLLAERLEGGTSWTGQPAAEPAGQVPPAQVAILLAERDPYAAELEEQFLTTEGFDVAVALSAAEARSALNSRLPAVAVIEPLISGGTGLDLCRTFKSHGVRVIVASVLQLREQALEAGADTFLGKPLDPLRLVAAVRDLLGLTPSLRPQQEVAL
jgi:DNA-binding transcriptional MerR regulator